VYVGVTGSMYVHVPCYHVNLRRPFEATCEVFCETIIFSIWDYRSSMVKQRTHYYSLEAYKLNKPIFIYMHGGDIFSNVYIYE
jgi:hypothetical protein